jgi:hypothetical protein
MANGSRPDAERILQVQQCVENLFGKPCSAIVLSNIISNVGAMQGCNSEDRFDVGILLYRKLAFNLLKNQIGGFFMLITTGTYQMKKIQ